MFNPFKLLMHKWREHKARKVARLKAEAMTKILCNLITPEAIDKIKRGEGCSWDLPAHRKEQAMEGVYEYVAAHEQQG